MDNQNQNQNPNNKQKPFKPRFNLTWVYLIIVLVLGYLAFSGDKKLSHELDYTTFEEVLNRGYVEKITCLMKNNMVEATIKNEFADSVFKKSEKAEENANVVAEVKIGSLEKFEEMVAKAQEKGVFVGKMKYESGEDWLDRLLPFIAPVFFILFFFFLMSRMSGGMGGGPFGVGRSKAQLFDKSSKHRVTFKDVAGLAGAKQEVEEIVSFLKNPKKYTELGGKIPKGALLVGPPGTGKTLLAKAVAGEADVPFFSLSGSDFVEMFVGVGASRVRDLFKQAKEKSPCIIFIDEIDAVGRARGRNVNVGSNDERESTLNQLLTEMDGFGSNSGIIVLAATNRADILDKALLRAGRFDRQIHVDLPDVHERIAIFKVHVRNLKMDASVDIDFLARQTPGFSGADIANVCNEAALIAARKDKSTIQKQDFLDAVDRIVGGLEKKTKITTEEEKRSIAYHEAGHATISWNLQYANPLVKVTIVPRGEALGAAWYLPEERQLTNREHILDEMCATLGGRAAEEVFFGTASTGALNDLERVTKQAYAMVAYYGMGENLPNLSFYDSTGQANYFTKPYSDTTAELIDKEAKRIVAEQYNRAKAILEEHREGHNALAKILIDREVLFADDVEAVLGNRKWKSRADEILADSESTNEAEPTEKPEIIVENDENIA